uniref:Putative dehydrogenase n=1 Tax=Cladonia uncialis subsp. uncialis TaxID=180999 RepID=A0A1Z1C4P0_CLAUC|nr:putative dehydrogenase [Cladonia uncialis subsp. uncialis]AUW31350.1 putative isoepoxydon dehydrogenase [Cladonia uncialis subsp. uncialis]
MVLQTGLEGAHMMITGGTRGMGRQMVETFLQEGANVSYSARTVDGTEFDDFHKMLPGTNKARAIGTSLDVSSKVALKDWVEASAKRFGRLDTVIANASPMRMDGTDEAWTQSINVDLMGFVNLVEASITYLEKSPFPSIIVQSSFMGREFYRSPPAAYGPCKAAQLQHVQELSHFLGPKGIRVNAISPGPILAKGGPWEKYSKEMPEWVEEQRLKIPLKRLGNTWEVANVAVFLASPLSSFVSGTNLMVDGGIHVGTQF